MINPVILIQENKILLKIYRVLSAFVQVIPYYIMEETCSDQISLNISLDKNDLKVHFLNKNDMEFIGSQEESKEKPESLITLLESGCTCLGAKYKGELVAYSWCNPKNLSYKGRNVLLKPNEAYLFDQRTYKAFRGKNLAPYIRSEFLKALKRNGIDRAFSITVQSNTASMKFKKKLGAKPIELYCYVSFFRRLNFHIRLKRIA